MVFPKGSDFIILTKTKSTYTLIKNELLVIASKIIREYLGYLGPVVYNTELGLAVPSTMSANHCLNINNVGKTCLQ